ncbi:TPA: hypothetical protein ACGAQA_002174 [Legionella pneumophila]|uniref:Uncharacterized protein n=2 Tax=Legionella TaxID=445 RepID=A0A3A6U2V1_LEGPN|nr:MULTISPECIES: hypothetical protein [Legionella]ERH40915.1 hypothetical protein N751_17580 [Legionella pneumophila str. Leg01/11]ANN97229.1 hypothetical protein A9P84_15770 [Legionella pneumophila]ERB42474.1 hypothetical protein N748_03785 [Legionella pneumophila str. 121004]MCW8433231.1 hypothetical protein [Legionella pneumophila]MCW8465677.1 hypothetical protein [Legionella pneumophila]
MKENDVITLRISEYEREYLNKIAHQFELQKRGSSDISPAKALKFLLEFCLHNEISPHKKSENPLQDIRKMIEQIHASIPHLMYHNHYQSLVISSNINDDSLKEIKQKTIEYLNDNFSGFQNNSYKEVRFKMNGIGLKTVPIEEGESLWK